MRSQNSTIPACDWPSSHGIAAAVASQEIRPAKHENIKSCVVVVFRNTTKDKRGLGAQIEEMFSDFRLVRYIWACLLSILQADAVHGGGAEIGIDVILYKMGFDLDLLHDGRIVRCYIQLSVFEGDHLVASLQTREVTFHSITGLMANSDSLELGAHAQMIGRHLNQFLKALIVAFS